MYVDNVERMLNNVEKQRDKRVPIASCTTHFDHRNISPDTYHHINMHHLKQKFAKVRMLPFPDTLNFISLIHSAVGFYNIVNLMSR